MLDYKRYAFYRGGIGEKPLYSFDLRGIGAISDDCSACQCRIRAENALIRVAPNQ